MKKIDFAEYSRKVHYGVETKWLALEDRIYLEIDGYGASFVSSPQIREFCQAGLRAADALEAAQRLTFADLAPGDWFRWAQHKDDERYALRKVDERTIVNPENWRAPHSEPLVHGNFAGGDVVRVKPTFVPEEPAR